MPAQRSGHVPVRPAHPHPHSDELIYILTGRGKIMIEGEVGEVRAGSAVLFEQGKVHMLRNLSLRPSNPTRSPRTTASSRVLR